MIPVVAGPVSQVVAPGEYIISARGAGSGDRKTCDLSIMAGEYDKHRFLIDYTQESQMTRKGWTKA